MDRRTLLKLGGMAAIGAGFGACGSRRRVETPSAGRPRAILAPVQVSWDRVIRTIVGLRPFRRSGFVLKADKLDDRLLIHNYGHGGAGLSLSWGCARLVADLAVESPARRAAVIGCGGVGLAVARTLQRRGFDVTIYAMSVPPDTTSNMALAGFTPTSSAVAFDGRTPEWDARFRQVAETTYRHLQLLVGAQYGVSWLYNYSPIESVAVASGTNQLLQHMPAEQVILQPGEHPFPTRFAARRASIRIEPSIYLEALVRDVVLFGARIVIRKFDTPRDLLTLTEPVIVNCTGLGSKVLFGDPELVPLKGQLVALLPQPEVDYETTGGGGRGGWLHMTPRSDGVILGGTREADVWSLEPNQEERKRIVEGHMYLFGNMRRPAPPLRAEMSAAPASVPALESHFWRES